HDPRQRPTAITFTSSSTVRNFVALLGSDEPAKALHGITIASIGPVTSATLRELGLRVDVEAKEYTIPGLVKALVERA
ncbi:MAG TPA: uroporphyrinogen-III synthase, partial [Terriglobales bacterium]|nr:uroporphyrinogen-III synthase [Terriglobales bacterium]